MKRCPHCNMELPDTALKCRYCKQLVSRGKKYAVVSASHRRFKKIIFIILITFILAAIIYYSQGIHGECYSNNTFGIKIRHPKEWKVFDINTYYYVYKGLSSTVIPDNSDIRLICAFSCSKDLKKLNPLITVSAQPIANDLKDLPAEELLKLMEQGLKMSPPSHTKRIKEHPSVYTIGDKKFARYTTTSTAEGAEWENIYYYFIKDTKLYIICLSSKADTIDMYRKVYDDIAGSTKI